MGKEQGASAEDLKKQGCACQELKAAGFSAAELKAARYAPAELKAAGFSAAELKAAGYALAKLKAAGFSAAELKAAGFSAAELKAARYALADLKAAGFSAAEVKAAGYALVDLKAELKAARYALADLKAAGFSAAELKAAGYGLADMKAAGYSALKCAPLRFPHADFAAAFNIRPDAKKVFDLANSGEVDELRILLAAGTGPDDYKDIFGKVALHSACYNGHLECAKALLWKGADINKQNNDGWTPLMEAAHKGEIEFVRELLKLGANKALKEKYNKTAYGKTSNEEIKALLRGSSFRQSR